METKQKKKLTGNSITLNAENDNWGNCGSAVETEYRTKQRKIAEKKNKKFFLTNENEQITNLPFILVRPSSNWM